LPDDKEIPGLVREYFSLPGKRPVSLEYSGSLLWKYTDGVANDYFGGVLGESDGTEPEAKSSFGIRPLVKEGIKGLAVLHGAPPLETSAVIEGADYLLFGRESKSDKMIGLGIDVLKHH
jgi:hypothetical protein